MDAIANNDEITDGSSKVYPRLPGRARKLKLINRVLLDGRSAPAKEFNRLSRAIVSDLGGEDQLSAIELALIEAFCGASIVVGHLNAELLQGNAIDPTEHSAAVGAMVRVGSRLGLSRRARDVSTPTLRDILRDDLEAQQREAAE
jgi:hypothetical protein